MSSSVTFTALSQRQANEASHKLDIADDEDDLVLWGKIEGRTLTVWDRAACINDLDNALDILDMQREDAIAEGMTKEHRSSVGAIERLMARIEAADMTQPPPRLKANGSIIADGRVFYSHLDDEHAALLAAIEEADNA